MALAFDPDTISFYDREAAQYARSSQRSTHIDAFIAAVGTGAKVLELGCGAGHDAEALIAAGIDVTATEASSQLAAIASARIGRMVRVMRFDEMADSNVFDGVWANACLLHVPVGSLAGVLTSVRASLRFGGVFFATFKAGDREGRDRLGRYYNFPNRVELESCYARAGHWTSLSIKEGVGSGYDGVERLWFACTAIK
jgi:SAM-dependent methyltransferase